jgi:hypothetical protein
MIMKGGDAELIPISKYCICTDVRGRFNNFNYLLNYLRRMIGILRNLGQDKGRSGKDADCVAQTKKRGKIRASQRDIDPVLRNIIYSLFVIETLQSK